MRLLDTLVKYREKVCAAASAWHLLDPVFLVDFGPWRAGETAHFLEFVPHQGLMQTYNGARQDLKRCQVKLVPEEMDHASERTQAGGGVQGQANEPGRGQAAP